MIPVLAEIQNPARIEQLLLLFLQAGQDNVQKGRNSTPSPRAAVPPTHFLSENAKKTDRRGTTRTKNAKKQNALYPHKNARHCVDTRKQVITQKIKNDAS
ncbi:MAG: hypothetical protein IIU02_11405 [Treponema sp.]|uniref:hypothetical protein n=1 Tax=Treponema sp. TaxID=166 RepID=UPI00257E11B2|nr:hypothetical protein [Treponema sp.]MBQ5538493.1 hypothetical protein [Treponema sp.]